MPSLGGGCCLHRPSDSPPPYHGEHARLAETVRGIADHGIEEAAGTSTTVVVVVVVVVGTGTVVMLPEPERQLMRVRSDVFRRCRSGGGGGVWVAQLRVVEAQAQEKQGGAQV